MRKVIVILEVNDDKAIEENMGTLDYLEREIGWIEESGIYMKNVRILDEDDLCDVEAIKMSNMIFNFNKED